MPVSHDAVRRWSDGQAARHGRQVVRTAGRAESAYRRTVAEQDDHDVWIVLLAVNGISLDSSEPPQIQLDAVILPIDLACACAGDLQ